LGATPFVIRQHIQALVMASEGSFSLGDLDLEGTGDALGLLG